ncbi:PREDICTED: zinc finger BED domain-containing protein DAYSLEEPER-like [Camelina sativa]|uniref:Zinc finger BED domain-containing protein DAYSLEEPER-like n=1 Tax=Camelina sativa TaxID=90675 RepID=A0ABM0U3R5_CAMSA|nr:PREDICTED: zinc finger BED domain-containing protein DAYSLEEPER-like [Camelina sativa]
MGDTLNLEDDYMSGDDYMLEHDMNPDEEEHVGEERVEADSVASTADKRTGKSTGKRKRSRCWKNFEIVGDKLDDGRNNLRCTRCEHTYCLDLRRSGTNTLLRHMESCSKTPGSTPSCGNRKLDMMVFREMIGLAIIEHDLPYSFVEYKRIREAFQYANSNIEFWSRNTAAADCLKIYEKEKLKLRKMLDEVPGRFCLTTDLWRAITIEGYMCLTAHYIDSG